MELVGECDQERGYYEGGGCKIVAEMEAREREILEG